MDATSTVAPARRPLAILRVAAPAAAGVAGAIALGSQGSVAPLIMLCGAIYLFAAAIGRRWGSWVGFAVSFLVLAPGILLHNPWIPIIALMLIQVALVIVGQVRHAWRTPENRVQLLGALIFSALAIAAAAGVAPWAGILAVLGLLGHGVWDFWHHHTEKVVLPSYAVFCGVLDIALAIIVAAAMLTTVF